MNEVEAFCDNCFAGTESNEHREKCVRPRETLQDHIEGVLWDNANPEDWPGQPHGHTTESVARAIIDYLGLKARVKPGYEEDINGIPIRSGWVLVVEGERWLSIDSEGGSDHGAHT